MSESLKLKDSACACDTCKEMCHRPCWPTAEEVASLVAEGFADRLMADWWEESLDDGGITWVITPAVKSLEGKQSPRHIKDKTPTCTFQTDEGLCELHELGLKPLEGRVSSCQHDYSDADVRASYGSVRGGVIRDSWRTEDGRNIANLWGKEFLQEDLYED